MGAQARNRIRGGGACGVSGAYAAGPRPVNGCARPVCASGWRGPAGGRAAAAATIDGAGRGPPLRSKARRLDMMFTSRPPSERHRAASQRPGGAETGGGGPRPSARHARHTPGGDPTRRAGRDPARRGRPNARGAREVSNITCNSARSSGRSLPARRCWPGARRALLARPRRALLARPRPVGAKRPRDFGSPGCAAGRCRAAYPLAAAAFEAFAQSALKISMPRSVSGWWTICLRTLKGIVAMWAPASAASVTWRGWRTEAVMISAS